jgi:hypothetical protein
MWCFGKFVFLTHSLSLRFRSQTHIGKEQSTEEGASMAMECPKLFAVTRFVSLRRRTNFPATGVRVTRKLAENINPTHSASGLPLKASATCKVRDVV